LSQESQALAAVQLVHPTGHFLIKKKNKIINKKKNEINKVI
jgi:hypothetical protein